MLSSLHAVELQLIAHHLDLASILRFARCNRSILAAASAEFAFRFCSATVLSNQPDLSGRIARSLIQFVPQIKLRLCRADSTADCVTKAMLSLPRLTSLDALSRPIVHLPTLIPIAELRRWKQLHWKVPDDPRKDTCWFDEMCVMEDLTLQCWPSDALFASLERLRWLTALDLSFDVPSQPTSAQASSIGRCVQLRRLSLSNLVVDQLSWIVTGALADLVELTLTNLHVRPGEQLEAGWLSCVNELRRLSRLSFLCCPSVLSTLFDAIAELGPNCAIETVTVVPHPADIHLPTAHEFTELMQSWPLGLSLSVELFAVHKPAWECVVRISDPGVIRYRGVETCFGSYDTLLSQSINIRSQCLMFAMLDPTVQVCDSTVTHTRDEEDDAIARRFDPAVQSTNPASTCVLS